MYEFCLNPKAKAVAPVVTGDLRFFHILQVVLRFFGFSVSVRTTFEHGVLAETFSPLHCAASFPHCDYFSLAALCRLQSANSDRPHFASFPQVQSLVGDSSQFTVRFSDGGFI